MRIRNTLFDTYPGIVHADGLQHKRPNAEWEAIKAAFFGSPALLIGSSRDISAITVNNCQGNLFERSMEHRGVPCVTARKAGPWSNAVDKPALMLQALGQVATPYTLFADSLDALLLTSPADLLALYLTAFPGESLLFGAQIRGYPFDKEGELREFEASRPGAIGPFLHLNSGAWIGRTGFAKQFFGTVVNTPAMAWAPWSEQGKICRAWLQHPQAVSLDYRCQLFQNNASRFALPYLEIVQ